MPHSPLAQPRPTGLRQLIVTLGPTSFDKASALAAAGATAFRLNASHMAASSVRDMCDRIRGEQPAASIVVDLQGAKIRFGDVAPRAVARGDRLTFVLDAHDAGAAVIAHPEVFASVAAGETLSADDDRLRFRIERVGTQSLDAVALNDGVLRPRKGVNVVEHPVDLTDLSSSDAAILAALDGVAHLAFALSFMRDGSETAWVRRRVPDAIVVGKVERREAMANLSLIDERTDAIWICRGDLGAQIGMGPLARFVAGLDPGSFVHPVIMAGQVLEHLTEHDAPTRSEVCHVFDLMARGYDGIVLSDETAIGKDPVRAVATAAALLGACAP